MAHELDDADDADAVPQALVGTWVFDLYTGLPRVEILTLCANGTAHASVAEHHGSSVSLESLAHRSVRRIDARTVALEAVATGNYLGADTQVISYDAASDSLEWSPPAGFSRASAGTRVAPDDAVLGRAVREAHRCD